MKRTAPTPAHRPIPTHNRAAHNRAEATKEAQQNRREAAVTKTWEQTVKRGYKQALYRFTRHQHGATETRPTQGTYEIRAVSHATGEIRKYWTAYEENVRFIANTDFLANDKETTTYIIWKWTYENTEGGRILAIRTASKGEKPKDETPSTTTLEDEIRKSEFEELKNTPRPSASQRRRDLDAIFGSFADALIDN